MIKFCPMCGSKVIVGSKFCNGCGLNLTDYQKKLDRLAASEKSPPPRAGNIVNAPTELPATSARQQKDSVPDFNLQEYIRSLGDKYGDLQKVYFNVEDAKSKTKIQAAQRAYAGDAKKENVIFVFDDTVFGAADDGFLVTDKNIYVHNMDEAALKISLAEINSCSIKKTLFNRRIVLNNNAEIQLTGYDRPAAEKMRDLFKEIRATFCGQAATTVSAPASTELPANTARQQKDSGSDSNLQEYIRSLDEKYGYLDKVYFNLQKEKNQRKINSARKAYDSEATDENVIFVFDETFFGSADQGFLVTDKKIYVRCGWESFSIAHAGIRSYSFEKEFFAQKVIGSNIIMNDAKKISMTSYTEPQARTMVELLKDIKATFSGQAATTISAPAPPPAQPISQETPRGVELTEEFAYYTPPPPFTPPPPTDFLGEFYMIKNKTECRTENQKYMLENFVEAINDLATHEYDDFPTIKSDMQQRALSRISLVADLGYMLAIYFCGHIYYDGDLTEKNWSYAKRYFERFAVYGEDEDEKKPNRLIALGRFSTIMRHNYPRMRIDILKPEVFHYYLRELLETSLAVCYPLKCVYFNTAHCDRKTLKKINSALEVYVGKLKEFEFPLIVFDPTTDGSAIEGCLFSNFGIYIRNRNEKTTHFVDYESYETEDIAIRGLIFKDVYVGEQKIEISSCNYGDSERMNFAYIVRDMGGIFGKR